MRIGLAVACLCGLLLAGCSGATSNSNGSGGGGGIAPSAPTAVAGGPYTGTAGTAVSFTAAGSVDPQGQTLTYAWNFGDSSTGTGATASHAYAAAGTYTVTLTATDTSGLSGSATSKATIAAAPLTDVALTGSVMSGSQPVVGAHVYLFAAGTSGYGGAGIAASSTNASVSLLSASQTGTVDGVGAYVTSGANGQFSLTGDYSCATGQQMYVYVDEVNGTETLTAISPVGMMAAVGPCPASAASAISVTVNEVSTIAAAYALAGFATDPTHVSSSGTALAQVGIANAFANAANLETLSTGVALATTPAGNGTVPQAEINTLANILAACVNSTGVASSECTTLFANAESSGSSGTAVTDTASAAINIAHNPGANVGALYALASTNTFTPGLAAKPADLTAEIAYTGSELSSPFGVAIDGAGDAWIANPGNNSVAELSSTGMVRSGSAGYSGGGMTAPRFVAIDSSGDAWVAGGSNNVVEFSGTGSILSGSNGYSGLNSLGSASLVGSSGIAIDGSGNVWVPNSSGNFGVSEFTNTGSFVGWINGLTYTMSAPQGVAVDASGTAWIPNLMNNTVSEFSTAANFGAGGTIQPGGGLDEPSQVAIDGSGSAWITNVVGNSVSKVSKAGTALSGSSGYTGSGLGEPLCIAIDGGGNAWIGTSTTDSVVELSNGGTVLSGGIGYRTGDQLMIVRIAVDGSGDVWTTNGGSVNEIVGAAVPVVTPLAVGVKNSMLGTRP